MYIPLCGIIRNKELKKKLGLGGQATESETHNSLRTLVPRPVSIFFRKPDIGRSFVAMILRQPYDGEYIYRFFKGEVPLRTGANK